MIEKSFLRHKPCHSKNLAVAATGGRAEAPFYAQSYPQHGRSSPDSPLIPL